ncbi:Glycerol-3-phosphate dehydrogenase [NAD(P)+] [Acidisarcina polymorpha]|uniref:Glycerol-3-phosphate dehydrogenase [NAD(P)+] n=1 Tax=Acidisarcina polymorpha TaxID=2211140 RepID=A0A2Z5G3K2_9BACT|nr:NAD(P)H-dependent glycerol-3-phosphate dehydrogenase [Acidisarcina polymorpha]AXC13711.1 Glycerol-3-phosphate dehydrogenase [NAD(P)+] [Acidisarcina polymorpha]
MSRIAILGSGAWGTALAVHLSQRSDHNVVLWTRSPAAAAEMRQQRENLRHLPGFALPAALTITSEAIEAVADAEIVVSVVPSEHLRATYTHFAPWLRKEQILVSATKGIEDGTLLRMTEVIRQTLASSALNPPCGVLSGPSFAQEVAAGSPTALTIAFVENAFAAKIQREFSSATLRLYTNEDLVGVELGGALKNVIAIASGVVTGLILGHNAAAALITRGIAEITRLAVACGGRRTTLAGLSGLGDLVLTCTGSLSRNRLVGMELGKGRALEEILTGLDGKVAEGVRTTFAALDLANSHGIEMPITEQVAAILSGRRSPLDAMRELMARPGKDE